MSLSFQKLPQNIQHVAHKFGNPSNSKGFGFVFSGFYSILCFHGPVVDLIIKYPYKTNM